MTGRGGPTALVGRGPRGGGGAFVGGAFVVLIIAFSPLLTSSVAAQSKPSTPARVGRTADASAPLSRDDDAARAATGSIAELSGTPTSQPTAAGRAAPGPTPSTGRARGAFEGEAIRRRPAAASGASATRPAVPKVAPPTSDFRRVALALGVVIALIFLARGVAKRVFPVPGVGGGTRAVQVLARLP